MVGTWVRGWSVLCHMLVLVVPLHPVVRSCPGSFLPMVDQVRCQLCRVVVYTCAIVVSWCWSTKRTQCRVGGQSHAPHVSCAETLCQTRCSRIPLASTTSATAVTGRRAGVCVLCGGTWRQPLYCPWPVPPVGTHVCWWPPHFLAPCPTPPPQ